MYSFPRQESQAPKAVQPIELSREETPTAIPQQEPQVPKAIQSIELSREKTPTAGAWETKQANLEDDSSSLLGNPCVLPTKAGKKARNGVNELYGRMHFRRSNTFGNQWIK